MHIKNMLAIYIIEAAQNGERVLAQRFVTVGFYGPATTT